MEKRILIIFGLLGISYSAFSQDSIPVNGTGEDVTIQRNIEVVKEYNPVIKESGKISTMPELEDIPTPKRTHDFSVWTTSYIIKPSSIPTLPYAIPAPEKEKNGKERFARIGAGTYSSFLGELYTPIVKNKRNLLDFHVLHNSSFGDVKLTDKLYEKLPATLESKATNCNTRAKISYSHAIKNNKEFSTFVYGKNNVLKYYGYDSLMQKLAEDSITNTDNDSLKQVYNRLGVNFRFRSKEYISKWKYDLQASYHLFANKQDLFEHTIHTNLYGSYRFDNSSLHFTFDMHNIIMGLPESDEKYTFERGETLNNYTLIKLLPHYYFSGDLGEITVGVKGAFSINQGKKGAVTPNVFGKAKLIKDILYVYAGVTGDYTVNNYQKITEENLYVAPNTRVEDSYIPIDAYVGLTFKIAKRVNMDLHAGYKLIDNPYFFINRCDTTSGIVRNEFDVVYDKKAGVLNAGLSANYAWNNRLNLHFNGEFNKWNVKEVEEAWHKPKWKMNVEGTFLATNHLRFRLGYLMEAGKYALVNDEKVKLPTAHNICVGADYRLLNWLNFFVNFDNIANQKYSNWYGYTQHGFNFMGGISMIF